MVEKKELTQENKQPRWLDSPFIRIIAGIPTLYFLLTVFKIDLGEEVWRVIILVLLIFWGLEVVSKKINEKIIILKEFINNIRDIKHIKKELDDVRNTIETLKKESDVYKIQELVIKLNEQGRDNDKKNN